MFMDDTLLYILEYFGKTLANLQYVAMDIAKIVAFLGILWSGFQMASGTLDTQKFLVGNIVRYMLFFLIMHFYAPFVNGLLDFSVAIAQQASPQSISSLTDDFVKVINSEKKKLEAQSKALDSLNGELKNVTSSKAQGSNWATKGAASMLNFMSGKTGKEKKLTKESIKMQANQASAMKKLDSLNSVLNEWEVETSSGKKKMYALDLDFKRNGKSTGFISPAAIFNVALVTAQTMIDNEWTKDVMAENHHITLTSNAEESNGDDVITEDELAVKIGTGEMSFKLLDFPAMAMFRFIICFIAAVALIITTITAIIQYMMAMVEFFITTGISVILIPLMLMDNLKDYAMRVLGTLFGQMLKLVVINVMIYFCLYTFMSLAKDILGSSDQFGLVGLARCLLTGILAFTLTSHAPTMASTINSGNPQMSMGEFIRGAAAAGAAATMAGSAGMIAAKAGAKGIGAGAKVAGKGYSGVANAVTGMGNKMHFAKTAAAQNGKQLSNGQAFGAAVGKSVKDVGASVRDSFRNAKENAKHTLQGGGKEADTARSIRNHKEGAGSGGGKPPSPPPSSNGGGDNNTPPPPGGGIEAPAGAGVFNG